LNAEQKEIEELRALILRMYFAHTVEEWSAIHAELKKRELIIGSKKQ